MEIIKRIDLILCFLCSIFLVKFQFQFGSSVLYILNSGLFIREFVSLSLEVLNFNFLFNFFILEIIFILFSRLNLFSKFILFHFKSLGINFCALFFLSLFIVSNLLGKYTRQHPTLCWGSSSATGGLFSFFIQLFNKILKEKLYIHLYKFKRFNFIKRLTNTWIKILKCFIKFLIESLALKYEKCRLMLSKLHL